ncbi:MAG: HAD family hydrolase [Clostridia bacterium]|nr:HAD family hydrolase [Clostridia bacterium]
MTFDSLIFDMDGTLWNTVPEIIASWKETIARLSLPMPEGMDELQKLFGLNEKDVADALFPALPEEERINIVQKCSADERSYLITHGTTIYPRLVEVLEKLSKRFRLFIVSNCSYGYIETFFEIFGTEKYFEDFEHFGRTGLKKGQNIKLLCERNGLRAPAYVGDTVWDADACEEAGVPFIYASYGLGEADASDRACMVLKEFVDLLTLLPEEEH